MGMFDTVNIQCPSCTRYNEIQSKAGRCVLNEYTLENAPRAIKEDLIDRELYCDCGKKLIIKEQQPINLCIEVE